MSNLYKLCKSRYCRAIQCLKMLWLEKNKPEEACGETQESVFVSEIWHVNILESFLSLNIIMISRI